MVSAGFSHTVLLRSDGHAVAFGRNNETQCNVPPLNEGLSYIQVSAGYGHSVLLRSDGCAVAFGSNSCGECSIPPLDEGVSYTQVSAGHNHTVLLRSDGNAVACGKNIDGQCKIPPLDKGMSYIQVSAGGGHTVLLRSDGNAVACGKNDRGQCHIEPLDAQMSYTQVFACGRQTFFLRSDGSVQMSTNTFRDYRIPPLEGNLTYTQISASGRHVVLLRSNGSVVACGADCYGQCDVPRLEPGIQYMGNMCGGSWSGSSWCFFVSTSLKRLFCRFISDLICINPIDSLIGYLWPIYIYVCIDIYIHMNIWNTLPLPMGCSVRLPTRWRPSSATHSCFWKWNGGTYLF